ncbi:MAG: hypothetical protein ABUL66_02120, partial [Verrucomicrobiota bacterium]
LQIINPPADQVARAGGGCRFCFCRGAGALFATLHGFRSECFRRQTLLPAGIQVAIAKPGPEPDLPFAKCGEHPRDGQIAIACAGVEPFICRSAGTDFCFAFDPNGWGVFFRSATG